MDSQNEVLRPNKIGNGRDRKWHAVLWCKQDYPDTYMPIDSAPESVPPIIRSVSRGLDCGQMQLVQHECALFLFASAFMLLRENLYYNAIEITIGASLVLGYRIFRFMSPGSLKNDIRSAALIGLTIVSLSPVVRSLARSTSQDSIFFIVFALMSVNTLARSFRPPVINQRNPSQARSRARKKSMSMRRDQLNNINYLIARAGIEQDVSDNGIEIKLQSAISTTSAILASVVLSSRLDNNTNVSLLVSLAVELFGLFPIFSTMLESQQPVLNHTFTTSMVLLTGIIVLVSMGLMGLYVHIFLLFCISVALPIWYSRFVHNLVT